MASIGDQLAGSQPHAMDREDIRQLLMDTRSDLVALKATVDGNAAIVNATNTKLNADAGVTDTDYATNAATAPELTLEE